ncbi:hypothetical protein [Klebsiella phage 05F01]|nr:hypothetical protein [Klebsiella phage 05F01]
MRNFVIKNDYNRSSVHRDKKNDYSRQWKEDYLDNLETEDVDNDTVSLQPPEGE